MNSSDKFRIGDAILLARGDVSRNEWPLEVAESCEPGGGRSILIVIAITAVGTMAMDLRRLSLLEVVE